MTVPDFRAAERRFTRTLERALHEFGYTSYAEAQRLRNRKPCPEPERARWFLFQCEWSDALRRAAKVTEKPVSNGTGKRHGTPALKVKRSPDDYEPLTPAVLAECRVRLAEAMEPGKAKGGRSKRQPLVVGMGR